MFMDLKTLNEAFSLDESYYNGVYLTNDNYESDQIVSIVGIQVNKKLTEAMRSNPQNGWGESGELTGVID